jgi:hypothetical protein
MRRIWLPALISVLLIGTTAVPALAGKDLPFKAKTVVVNEQENNGCTDTDHVGTGTHLGRFDLSETLCVVPPFFDVVGTLVAANGDELYFTAEGEFDLDTFELVWSTGWVFDGGTGRFENATGQADETLIRESPTGPIIGVTVKGTISFEASDRSN